MDVPRPLLDELVGWIALHTGYDLRITYTDPPRLSFCAAGDTIDYGGEDLLVDPALRAAYDLTRRRIYLVRPWDPVNLFDRSVLLHELIHDAQWANRDWPCPGALEWEAYRLQDQWLRERGIVHPFDWDAIATLSRCPAEGDG